MFIFQEQREVGTPYGGGGEGGEGGQGGEFQAVVGIDTTKKNKGVDTTARVRTMNECGTPVHRRS